MSKIKRGLSEYYSAYKEDVRTDSFKVAITALSDYQFYPQAEDKIQSINLFKDDPLSERTSELTSWNNIDLTRLALNPSYDEIDLSDYDSRTRTGFLRFEITSPEMGFGHKDYPQLFAETVIENTKSASDKKRQVKLELPNEPYTPQLRSIGLSYSAETTMIFNVNRAMKNEKKNKDKFLHIHPFGNKTIFHDGLPMRNFLLPQFLDEGTLIIGLENVKPPQEISIYFELEDNIINEINRVEISEINWKYLVDDDWVNFQTDEVGLDTTNQFTTSGIVQLKLPNRINDTHEILPSGVFWVSASIASNTRILSKTIFVKTNATSASWKPHRENEQWREHLPAGTIEGLSETTSEIIAVHQPCPSFGGRQQEDLQHFYTRVAERIKHKNRAQTPEDYERLILHEFPWLFQAKCFTNFSHPDDVKAGEVKIVVLPRLNANKSFYEPRTDYNELSIIEEFLKTKVSPFVSVEVINPIYERMHLTCNVLFIDDRSVGNYMRRLQEDLVAFICPWFSKEQQEVSFGGSVDMDRLRTFLESLVYVEFVTKVSFVILHYNNGEYSLSDTALNEGNNILTASNPWAIITPDNSHDITVINKVAYEAAIATRIETMKLGENFIVEEDDKDEEDFMPFELEKDTYYTVEIDI